jgi:hypothetical protein
MVDDGEPKDEPTVTLQSTDGILHAGSAERDDDYESENELGAGA